MEGVTATNGKEKVMFEHKTEEEARKEILSMVEGYYQTFHAKKRTLRKGIAFRMLPGYTIRMRCAILWTVRWNSG